jgi:CMP-N-acetylneuraminic acid synthetase
LRILALVTARGGSKRVPGKNIRVLGSRPLILWTIDTVRGVVGICDILLSTDDYKIAQIGLQSGAMVPWLRPEKLATDTASSVEVAIHGLDWYEREHGAVDGLLLLQPTSPFRRRESVIRGIDLFVSVGMRPVVGVSAACSHPMWCYTIQAGAMQPFLDTTGRSLRSQDLPRAYVLNGAFYLIAPRQLRSARSFIPPDAAPLVLDDQREAIDIDSEWHWRLAQAVAAWSDLDSI